MAEGYYLCCLKVSTAINYTPSEKRTLVVTLNVCVPSNSGRWHHRPHLWECMFLYVGIHLATPRTFPWWCFFFFSFFSCLIIIFFLLSWLAKFHRPVSGNIGKFEIIFSLSLVDSTLPNPIYSDERTREGQVFFNTTKDPLRQKLAKTIKTTLIRCVCFLLKWITFIPTRSFHKFGRTFLYLKFQIKAQNNTGKFSLCFHVVNKMALGVLVAIGVVIAKLKSFLTVRLPFWLEIQTALVDSSVDAAVVGLTLQSTSFYY